MAGVSPSAYLQALAGVPQGYPQQPWGLLPGAPYAGISSPMPPFAPPAREMYNPQLQPPVGMDLYGPDRRRQVR